MATDTERENDNNRDNDNLPEEEEELLSMEHVFSKVEVPSWRNQITFRAIVVSLLLSVVFSFIVCKLNLTTGIIPSLNVAAGLLGFAFVKSWTKMLHKCGYLKQPFTRQENTVIQTCVVASSGIAFSSGTGSYLLGMSPVIAATADAGNNANNVKTLSLGWIIPFLFIVSFAGLFSIVALRKMMILKYKLTYPSGTATAHLINSIHAPSGSKLAKQKVMKLFQSFSFSFLFAMIQWLFAKADGCGFGSIPTFGRSAYKKRFYFDFSSTYVGVGMICPYMVNVSLLIGAIISWAIMWPWIESKKGDWYSASLKPSSLHGIQGYRVFLAIAMMLGDGLYHILFMLVTTFGSLCKKSNPSSKQNAFSSSDPSEEDIERASPQTIKDKNYDESRRLEYFLKDQIPLYVACAGYLAIAAISIGVLPVIFHQVKWYHITVAYVIAPLLAFCNAYGCGLTDWSLASNYGKIAILVFSAWIGLENGGVLAGLILCGVMMSIVSTAADLMQDFKTGYLTLSSPRSMFFGQVLGTAMGCTVSPLVFWTFYKAYPIGDPDGPYPAPYGLLYRGIALLGVEGFSSLPKNCAKLAIYCFVAALVINILSLVLEKLETKFGLYRFIPSPMCMAIPFYLGGYFTIDMCLGSLIVFVWRRSNKTHADEFSPAVASGLICGESLWGVPAAILALAGVNAPWCLKV